MSDVKIRHIIQVKEDNPTDYPFFSLKCCEISPTDYGVTDMPEYMPTRCSIHNTQLMKWRRKSSFSKKWTKAFTKNYIRWRFVKMLTITVPDYMHIENIEKYLEVDTRTYLRSEILRRFRKLTRSDFWNKHVDGGQWFFECPINEGKANPHFHVMLVGPKLIDQKKLGEKLEQYHLGKISKFSSPKNKQGVIQKMTYWRNRKLIMNKSAVTRAINYCLKYVTKEEVYDGKNNSYFGKLSGNKRK